MIERPKSSEPPVAPENTGRANFDLQTGRDLRKILRKQTRYSLDQNLSNNRVNIFRASIVLLLFHVSILLDESNLAIVHFYTCDPSPGVSWINPRGKHARGTVMKIRAPRRANPSLNLSWPIVESVLHAACTQTRTGRGSMHREPSRRVRVVHAEWWGESKRGGAEGWGRGRRVRCSIGHYLRRVTGSVVTAPRFAHWLPVLHRSPTLSPSLSRPSVSFLPRSLRLSPLRLLFFVYSLRSLLAPTARLSPVSPLRNLAHDSRGGRRRLDLGLEARRAARKTSAFFLPAFAAGEATFHEAASFFAGDTTVTVVFERGGSPRCATRGGLFLAAESTSFRIINSPVTDISRPGWWG